MRGGLPGCWLLASSSAWKCSAAGKWRQHVDWVLTAEGRISAGGHCKSIDQQSTNRQHVCHPLAKSGNQFLPQFTDGVGRYSHCGGASSITSRGEASYLNFGSGIAGHGIILWLALNPTYGGLDDRQNGRGCPTTDAADPLLRLTNGGLNGIESGAFGYRQFAPHDEGDGRAHRQRRQHGNDCSGWRTPDAWGYPGTNEPHNHEREQTDANPRRPGGDEVGAVGEHWIGQCTVNIWKNVG